MDRYKFRGKRLDNGEWVIGDLIRECTGECFIVVSYLYGEYGENVGRDWHLVDPASVGQYTGLKDKHGKEIFEGDIVRKVESSYAYRKDYDQPPIIGGNYNGLEVISFEVDPQDGFLSVTGYGYRDVVSLESFRFWLKSESFGYEGEDLEDPEDFVVIGNIHDNPELLAVMVL